jgi:undecaprenyl-diphosphatase
MQIAGLREGVDALAGRLPPRARDAVHRLTRTDGLLLLRVLIVVLAAWVFLGVANAVSEGSTRRYDEAIMRGLRTSADPGVPIGPRWGLTVMRDLTSLGSVAVLTTFSLAVLGYLVVRRQHHAAVLVLVATGGGGLLSSVLKGVFERDRPDVVPHLVSVSSLSFPSGHALASAVVYLTLGALLSRLVQARHLKVYCVAVAVYLSFVVGLSRVYLGVHYPSDVLAGWTAGLCWALMCWTVASSLQKSGTVEQPK